MTFSPMNEHWIGLDWVSNLADWVGLDLEKWTHGHLWTTLQLHLDDLIQLAMLNEN